ncbi:MAG: hypothetical protein CL878_06340 [Dehalococcoidia bacterium]|nr:hypothetical protein [Dehalococcoidia bacterium]
MLQDVLSSKPPSEVIDEAARFFSQRRLKVIERSKSSLRFALSAAHEAEAGQVKAVRDASGQTRVSVETGGLSVWHVAESYLRDLRKQSRSGARSRKRRRAPGSTRLAGVSLDSLGSALGIEPVRRERRAPERPAPTPTPTPVAQPAADPAVALDDLVAPPPLAVESESDESTPTG